MTRGAWLLAALVLAGCSTPPASQPPASAAPAGARAARIDENALMRMHPFAPVVAQLNADIATLQATRSGGLNGAGAALVRSRAAIQAQLGNAEARARSMSVAPPALTHARPAAPKNRPVREAIAQYQQALADRDERAIALQNAQMREKEATVDYQYDRAHAGERLRLNLRLHSPYLDTASKHAIAARLKVLDAQETAVVNAQRSTDAAALARFRETLQNGSVAQLASMQRDLRAHAAAVARIPQPSGTVVARADAIPSHADTAKTAAAFGQASDDLAARFTQVHDWDAQAAGSTDGEIAALRAERDRLIAEMRAQIDAQAHRIARSRGLGNVYTGAAPSGADDLTPDVASAIQSIRGST